jgi:hypothetical protein
MEIAASIRFALLGATLACTLGHAADESSWTADAKGCRVWNLHPKADETVSWTGACRAGIAEGPGVVQWMEGDAPGTRFEGTLAAGKESGAGTLVFQNGSRYEGNFVDGVRTGKGVMTWPNGDRFEGDFVNNRREGKGTLVSSSGYRYEGEWKNDLQNGTGSAVWPDGATYSGKFADGKPADVTQILRHPFSFKAEPAETR